MAPLRSLSESTSRPRLLRADVLQGRLEAGPAGRGVGLPEAPRTLEPREAARRDGYRAVPASVGGCRSSRLCKSPTRDSPAPASRVAGITGNRHHARLIFVLLLETRFHHVGQAGLELLTSSVPPASASQSAGITGVSHRAQLCYLNFNLTLVQIRQGGCLRFFLPPTPPAPAVCGVQGGERTAAVDTENQLLPSQSFTPQRKLTFSPRYEPQLGVRIFFSNNVSTGKKDVIYSICYETAFAREVSLLLPRLECNAAISAHYNLRLLGSSDSPASVS
ncbi:hypothetical protein AAY473_010091 [Plecturocebus cupreus]